MNYIVGMNFAYYSKYIDWDTKGRSDKTTLFENPKVFANLVNDFTKPFKGKVTKVVGLDALGFIIGGAVAMNLEVGFVAIRKKGMLPGKKILRTSFTDYDGRKTFEINKSSLNSKDKVLIVDDWIHTGAQMNAAIKLIEKLGAKVVGISIIRAHKKAAEQLSKYNLNAINVKE